MIRFIDNRGLCALKDRECIAVIDIIPYGQMSLEITQDWCSNPIMPLAELSITSIINPIVANRPNTLHAYIEDFRKQKGWKPDQKLYLSVFPELVEKMDKHYLNLQNKKLWLRCTFGLKALGQKE